uniref:Uncharacterized protein n=1 Tax=Chelydra serpentina TaxID=8475 RepID=A0A8C3SJ35_CHESE
MFTPNSPVILTLLNNQLIDHSYIFGWLKRFTCKVKFEIFFHRLLDGLPPNPPHSQSSTFSVWPLVLPSVKDAVRPLAMTASSLYWWCQNSVAQSFEVIKDTIFPSRLYLRQLNMLKQQVEKLDIEFSRLQGAIQVKNSPCRRCNKPLLAVPACAQIGLAEPVSLPSAGVLQPASVPAPPPPPPLPPPPPPPPAPILLKKGNSTKALQVGSNRIIVFIQLVFEGFWYEVRETCLMRAIQFAFFTLRCNFPLFSGYISKRWNNAPCNFYDLFRSPGGTPLTNKENLETGTGLTPIMTQALRRKFQSTASCYLPLSMFSTLRM